MRSRDVFVIDDSDIRRLIKNRVSDPEFGSSIIDVLTDMDAHSLSAGIYLLLVWHNQGAGQYSLTGDDEMMHDKLYLTIISGVGNCSFLCEEMYIGDDDWMEGVSSILDHDQALVDRVVVFLEHLVYELVDNIFGELRGPGKSDTNVSMDILCSDERYIKINNVRIESVVVPKYN